MSSPAPASSQTARHRVSYAVFAALLLLATIFILATESQLPAFVASHFDAAGDPNAFMPRARYVRFVLCLAIGLPAAVVTVLSVVYRHARNMKLPHREYWLAPERNESTRSFLIAHGVWFGSLLVILICFMHWLELGANRLQPPHLSNEEFGIGMLAFLVATAVWIGALMAAFRRPAHD